MSDGYETEELTRIEAALDALVSPTSEDVFQATRPFDERAIASVAATRAGSGGGGGSSPILQATVRLNESDLTALDSVPFLVASGVPGKIIVYTSAVLVQGEAGSFGGFNIGLQLGNGAGWSGAPFASTAIGDVGHALVGLTTGWTGDHEPLTALTGQSMYLLAEGALTVAPGASAVVTVAYLLVPAS